MLLPLLIFALAVGTEPPPQISKLQRSLAGYLLLQYNDALRPLGKPIHEQQYADGWRDAAYWLVPEKCYVAIQNAAGHPKEIYSLQIAGDQCPAEYEVAGLHINDPESKIISLLGEPSSRNVEKDYPATLWKYDGRNYTVETMNGRVTSMRVFVMEIDKPSTAVVGFRAEDLRRALASHDYEFLMGKLAGDLEINSNAKSLNFAGAALAQLRDTTSTIAQRLWGQDGLAAALEKDGDPEVELRIRTEGFAGPVWKFPKNTNLKEIAFRWELGGWRIYEVSFREREKAR